MHPGMGQRPPGPFPGPGDMRGPAPPTSGPGAPPPPGQPLPMGPPTPVNPPTGEMGPEYERQAAQYEDWLAKQAMYLESQVKTFETQVQKLKRSKKTIQARQRLAKKNEQQLNPADTAELERISTEQSGLQKQLEAQRKLYRQHQHVMQDYKTKQQEQFGRMWSGGLAETPMPGSTPLQPRTPGGHNSVRLSPTARQEYEAYMQNRIRMANQQQQQNRMRPPTTILGDNNPFSEGFQQREQIQRPMIPPGMPGGPQCMVPGGLPPHPPGNMGMGQQMSRMQGPPFQGMMGMQQHLPQQQQRQLLPPDQNTTSSSGSVMVASGVQSVSSTPGVLSTATTSAEVSSTVVTTSNIANPAGVTSNSANLVSSKAGDQSVPAPSTTAGKHVSAASTAVPATTVTSFPISSGQIPTTITSGPAPGSGLQMQVSTFSSSQTTTSSVQAISAMSTSTSAVSSQSGPVTTIGPQVATQPILNNAGGMQGPSISTPQSGQHSGPSPQGSLGPRAPHEGAGSVPFFREQGMPFDGAGQRFPRPPGPGVYPDAPAQGQGNQGPRLPPYPGPPGMFPPRGGSTSNLQAPQGMEQNRMPFQHGIGFGQGMPQIAEQPAAPPPPPAPKEKKKRKKKKKTDDLEGAQSQPLPPSIPNQAMLGQIGSQAVGSTSSTNPSMLPPVTKPAELPRPQSETERRILEILNNSQKELQNPTSPSSARGGKSPRSRSPARAQAQVAAAASATAPLAMSSVAATDLDKGQGSVMVATSAMAVTQSATAPLHTGGKISDAGGEKAETKITPTGGALTTQSAEDGTDAVSKPFSVHIGQRMALSQQQQQLSHGPLPPGFPSQQHMQHLQNFARMQHFQQQQQQQFPGISEAGGQRLPVLDGHPQMALGGPRYPQLHGYPSQRQRFPQGINVGTSGSGPNVPHSFHVRGGPPPHMGVRPGHPGYPPHLQHQQQRMSGDPRMSIEPRSMMPGSHVGGQRMGAPPPHLTQPQEHPSGPLASSQQKQTPPHSQHQQGKVDSSHIHSLSHDSNPSVPGKPQASTGNVPHLQTTQTSSNQISSGRDNLAPPSSAQLPTERISPSIAKSVPTATVSSAVTSSLSSTSASSISPSSVSLAATSAPQPPPYQGSSISSNADVKPAVSQSQQSDASNIPSSDLTSMAATSLQMPPASSSKVIITQTSSTVESRAEEEQIKNSDAIHKANIDEQPVKQEVKNVCPDGIHCGTDDEDDEKVKQSKTACPDGVHYGIHCGTDDEDDEKMKQSKTACPDGIHCGTDDEDDEKMKQATTACPDGIHCGTDDEKVKRSKAVCPDGIHCGTDDEDDEKMKQAKTACPDGIHCGTDDEDDEKVKQAKTACPDGIHEKVKQSKTACPDGIHCGTDDEDDEKIKQAKTACPDGIHCGTDDEDDEKVKQSKTACPDGIHCGTDDEDDEKVKQAKTACPDGIHCGTDDEDEEKVKQSKTACQDGIHCGTDDEDEEKVKRSKAVCPDGIHCGTDDEDDEKVKQSKTVCPDGIHCGTDDEDDEKVKQSKTVCPDGIHCGTDDEDDEKMKQSKTVSLDGVYCGTDDEKVKQSKTACPDGIHCGTDDEDDLNSQSKINVKSFHKPNNNSVSQENDSCAAEKLTQNSSQSTTAAKNITNSNSNAMNIEANPSPTVEAQISTAQPLHTTSQALPVNITKESENKPVTSSETLPKLTEMSTPPSSEGLVLPVSIHHQISSQLAAVSKSLANFNPQVGVSSETSVSGPVRPSQTLSAFSDPAKLSSPSSVSPETTTNTSNLKTTSLASNQGATVREPGTQALENSSDLLATKAISEASSSAAVSTDAVQEIQCSRSEDTVAEAVQDSSSQPLAPASIQSSQVSSNSQSQKDGSDEPQGFGKDENVNVTSSSASEISAQPVIDGNQSVTKAISSVASASNFLSSEPRSVESEKGSSDAKGFPPLSTSTAPPQPEIKSAAISFPVNSFQELQAPAVSATVTSTSPLVASVHNQLTQSQASLSSFAPQPDVNTSSQSSQHSQASKVPTPSVVSTIPSSSPSTTASASSILGESVTNNTNTNNPTPPTSSPSSSYSTARISTPVETRIPPLRIRMDGGSQPQVYESPSREYSRTSSDFSTPPRSKAEGDLKLVLRKSSDGTAELISGPSFRDKKSRLSSSSSLSVSTPTTGRTVETSSPSSEAVSSKYDSEQTSSTIAEKSQSVSQQSGPTVSQPQAEIPNSQSQPTQQHTLSAPSVSSAAPPPNVRTLELNPASSSPMLTSTTSKVNPYMPVSSTPGASPSTNSTSSIANASEDKSLPKERSEPFSSGSKNVTYTKSADTDVVKINVNSSRTTGEGTKKIVRSYTTDLQALERLQSTIDAVASGLSTYEPDFDGDSNSRPESRDSRSSSASRPPSTPAASVFQPAAVTTTTTASASSVPTTTTAANDAVSKSTTPTMQALTQAHPTPAGISDQKMQLQQQQQHHQVHHQQQLQQQQQQQQQQMMRGVSPQQPRLPMQMHPQQQQQQQLHHQQMPQQHPQQQQQQHNVSSPYLPHSGNFNQPFHRMSRPPLDLLAQVSQSALSSAGTAMPTPGLPPVSQQDQQQQQQQQRSPFMSERSPSSAGMDQSPHQHYPGMPGPRAVGTSPGMVPPKPGQGQPSQAYMPSQQQPQPQSQQYMSGGIRPPHFAPNMMTGDPNSSGGFVPGQGNMPPLPHMQRSLSGSADGAMGGVDAGPFGPSGNSANGGPLISSPMSDGIGGGSSMSVGQVKQEPSEDSASADGSLTQGDFDLDPKSATHNELLKQLLGTGQSGRQLTPDSEDSLPSLTPEQQRQLEMIDSMPFVKETEISTPEWESKTPEEREKILEMRRQEYEQKRQEYEVSRKNKRKPIGGATVAGGAPTPEKKKRKQKAVGELGVEVPKKRSKKAKLKENQLKELEAQAETFLQQLHSMPPISLQEPTVTFSAAIMPIKGATSLTGLSALRGRFASGYLEGIEDKYGSLLFPQPPPGLRPSAPSAKQLAQRQQAKLRLGQASENQEILSGKESQLGPVRTSPRLVLPPQPRIEIKQEPRDKKEERETPDTIVSSSSPEFGFNEQDAEYPGLRPIDPATGNAATAPEDLSTSPVVPLVHPLPVKPCLDPYNLSGSLKQEVGLGKEQQPPGMDSCEENLETPNQPGSGSGGERDLTVNLPNLTSGLAQPFLDPALDQQVSVTLTLSTGAAQDIGAVISAIADLLKIAVPPTYEITRSPSPEMFRLSLTHKEEAVNIHTLMSTRPRFCQHCDVFVLCSGIAKFKREFPSLLEQEP
ncbi:LOW QUALITY PROTEIN: histone-lysine N-methyltransferase mll3, partial [Plakobranchus ocellatus]